MDKAHVTDCLIGVDQKTSDRLIQIMIWKRLKQLGQVLNLNWLSWTLAPFWACGFFSLAVSF